MSILRAPLALTLILLLAVGIGSAIYIAVWYWAPGPSFEGSTSGVWMALAVDVADGVFYRPISSDIGYGGTRYVPVFFLLYGGLLSIGLDPTLAGLMLMQVSVVLSVLAVFTVLVRLDVAPIWAFGIACIIYCTSVFQQYVTDVNADYLAVALSFFALAAYLKPNPNLIWIAFLCVVAFFTKFTALYVPAAIFFSMLFHQEWQRATRFAILGIGMIAFAFWLFQTASGGHMLASLRATTDAGTDWTYALGFFRRFSKELFLYGPAVGLTVLIAIWVWITDHDLTWRHPVPLSLIFILLGTLLTYTSQGIAGNHMIAVHVVALAVAGRAVIGPFRDRLMFGAGLTILSIMIVVTWLPAVDSPLKTLVERDNPTQSEIRRKIEAYAADGGPIFSINPTYPIVAGRPVVLLDAFNMRIFQARNDPAGLDLTERIRAVEFSIAIVHENNHFGFKELYRPVDELGRYLILVPR